MNILTVSPSDMRICSITPAKANEKAIAARLVNRFLHRRLHIYSTILILYRKLYINIVLIIVLNIKARQYNMKINLILYCAAVVHTEEIFDQEPIKS